MYVHNQTYKSLIIKTQLTNGPSNHLVKCNIYNLIRLVWANHFFVCLKCLIFIKV